MDQNCYLPWCRKSGRSQRTASQNNLFQSVPNVEKPYLTEFGLCFVSGKTQNHIHLKVISFYSFPDFILI